MPIYVKFDVPFFTKSNEYNSFEELTNLSDYDEIEYMTDCNFRRIPEAPNPEADMSSEPWYSVGPKDVFPEEFGHFLLGDRRVRKVFLDKHRDLLTYAFWQERKERIVEGHIEDIFPYNEAVRFTNRFNLGNAK